MPILGDNPSDCAEMVCSHSRLFRPAGGATWVRRIGADGLSTLRSFASKGAKTKRTVKAHIRPAISSERAENRVPYSLLSHRYSLKKLLEQRALCRPGGYGGAAAPDPIPNSAVKRSSADGTSSQDAGE